MKIKMLTSGNYGRGDLMYLGSCQDELDVRRRLLHSFEQRIERARREHMHLVDDIDLIPAHFGRIHDTLAQLSDIVHP